MVHEGELSVQRRAGVATNAARNIGSTIPSVAAQFLEAQPLIVIGTVDRDARVWASPVDGAVRVVDGTLRIVTDLHVDVPHVGILAIDMRTRRRMRVNGTAARDGDELVVTPAEVYSNCPQYIHPRPVRPDTSSMKSWIETSDTFFIATAHPQHGADASHRGGDPGFVTFDGERIVFPDYRGNNMFNTLGNLAVNPNCGLLFLDPESGEMLQIAGRGAIEWEPQRRVVIVPEVHRTASRKPFRYSPSGQ